VCFVWPTARRVRAPRGLTGWVAADRVFAVSTRIWIAAATTCFIASAAQAVFDVASIKPGTLEHVGGEGSRRELLDSSPSAIIFYNASSSSCIQWAYGVKPWQVIGPDWLVHDRFDIVAKNEERATKEQLRIMLQNLLADRFHLRLRHEMKTLPYFALVAIKNGPKLHPTQSDRDSFTRVVDGSFVFEHVTMEKFAERLSGLAAIDRPVFDTTNIEGTFDIAMKSAAREMLEDPSSIFSAVEYAGFKLESRKGPLDVLVVDHADRPTQN
jgi:uncharacterized protein (TIGR03435 family)